MTGTKWLVLGLTCLTVAAMGETPDPAPAGGGQKEPPRRMGASSMEHEGMLIRLLAPDSKIAKDIGLTETQSADLKKLVGGTQAETKESRAQLEKLALKQANLLSQDVPDEAAVMKIVEELGDLRTQIAKRQMQQLLAVQRILTPEQRTKLREQMKTRSEQLRDTKKEGRGPRDAGARPSQPPPPPPNPAVQ